MLAFKVKLTLIFLLFCFGVWIYRRRLIAKAADAALVAGLAHRVRLNRKAPAGRKSLMERVNAKANERTPRTNNERARAFFLLPLPGPRIALDSDPCRVSGSREV